MKRLMMICLGVLFLTGSLLPFDKPTGKSTIAGAVIVHVTGSYPLRDEPKGGGLDVRVVGEYTDENGDTKVTRFETETDKNGYYLIENVPAGRYLLKAIEMYLQRGTHVTLASEYGRWSRGERYRYWGLMGGQMISNERDLFERSYEVEADSGVIDLGVTYIHVQAHRRGGGGTRLRYSPNGDAPWVRLTLYDSPDFVDFVVMEYENYPRMIDDKVPHTNETYTRVAPADYFGLN